MDLTAFMREKQKKENRRLNEEEIKVIMRQVLSALDYLHTKGYLHRDVKPENFIINEKTLEVKMIDFGTCRDYSKNITAYTTYVSTRWYRSPEVVLRSLQYGPPADIFAAGCVMGELYNTNPLFPGTSEADQLECIFKLLGTPT
jgi:serine/threonine protein kinase